MKYILGKKVGMTTIYDKDRGALNVTLIQCGANTVSLVRTSEKDGYSAVQLSVAKTSKRTHKKEFRIDSETVAKNVGETMTVAEFVPGDIVSITGITKAKGFQGVMKRHGFKGSPRTHGHKHDHRAPGSVGAQQPQHVLRGKRMAGRMGGVQATSKNLEVVMVDQENNMLAVQGAVPGVAGRIVEIRG